MKTNIYYEVRLKLSAGDWLLSHDLQWLDPSNQDSEQFQFASLPEARLAIEISNSLPDSRVYILKITDTFDSNGDLTNCEMEGMP